MPNLPELTPYEKDMLSSGRLYAEAIKKLVDANDRIAELEEALRAIIAHQESIGGGLAVLSATRRIAVEALTKEASDA